MRCFEVGSWSRGAVSFFALLLAACQGNGPAGPTQDAQGTAGAPSSGKSSTSASASSIEILRAPENGRSFKVSKEGRLPQPAPRFRFKVTSPIDIPAGSFDVQLLNAGGKRCGGALISAPAFKANTPKAFDIANADLLMGPGACVYGVNCTPSKCRFPLITKKMRLILATDEGVIVQATESRQYTWNDGSTGH